jgi:hypothetical protein
MILLSFESYVSLKSRSSRPLLETVAVLFVAIAGWYLLEPRIVRLFPAPLSTYDRSAAVRPRSTFRRQGILGVRRLK